MDKNMNIGILLIATNKYIKFLDPLVDSINKYFLNNHKKTIFCFTDITDHKSFDNVIIIYQKHMQWPFTTLKRYEIFYNHKNKFSDIDVLYYLDVDMLITDYINDEFLPTEKDLIAVIHPGYRRDFLQSFERNTHSLAYVDSQPYVYHCGGVQGGKKESYVEVCRILSENINSDLSKNIIAVWHDESHWNKYLISNPDSYQEYSPEYCYPESWPNGSWNITLNKKIIALDKNHAEMRS